MKHTILLTVMLLFLSCGKKKITENYTLEITSFDAKYLGKWQWVQSSIRRSNVEICADYPGYESFYPLENNISFIIELKPNGLGYTYLNDSLLTSFFASGYEDLGPQKEYKLNGWEIKSIIFTNPKDSYKIGDTLSCHLPLFANSVLSPDNIRSFIGYSRFVKIE